jgi:Gpi18-like mannosyltransferase
MYDESAARRALIFFAAFPTAFYLFAAYTEALFLAFVLGAFLFMRRRRWREVGILGALAAMTRAQGVSVMLPFAIEFWFQWRRKEIAAQEIWTLGLIVLGGLGHWIWLTLEFGSLDVWIEAQLIWHRAVLPWEALMQVWHAMVNAPSLLEGTLTFVQLLSELLLLGAIVWSARHLPPAYTAYIAIVALPPLFVVTTYSSQFPLTGVMRFAILAFPLFLMLGRIPKQRWQTLLVALSFVMQTFWLMLFIAWVFVH